MPKKFNSAGRNVAEHQMTVALDQLAEFEKFKDEVLPALIKMYHAGASAEDMRHQYNAILEAKKITMAIKEQDTSKALAVIKDIQDRTEGKAKERTETIHKFEKLKDEELDALVISKLQELQDGDETKDDLPN